MKKIMISLLAMIALLSASSYAGPKFNEALEKGFDKVERLKMLGIWLLSRMEYLRSSDPCKKRLEYLQKLTEDAAKSKYSRAAVAIDEIMSEVVSSPEATPEQVKQALKDEFELLADRYSAVHSTLANSKDKSAQSWIALAPDPAAVRF